MPYVILHPEGRTISEVVEFVDTPTHHIGARYITPETEAKYLAAIEVERELKETLRTGIPKRARRTTK